jgi:predicted Zn-dependent protease
MKMRNRSWLPVFVWLLTAFLFFPNPAFGLSLDEEEKLGREFVRDIRRHYEFVEDEYAKNFIEELGAYLAGAVETKPFPLRFYIIPQNDMNAFAGPGGHMFFFTGLIDPMDDVDELAAVACHEMGHIMARHLSERIELSKKLNIATMAGVLAGILIGGDAAQAIMTGSMAAAVQTQLSFSRADERQADQLGFSYMKESGFDSSAMVKVLNRFQAKEVYGTDRIPAYLRTHPTGPERMSNIDSLLKSDVSLSSKKEVEEFRNRFPVFKTILLAGYGDPVSAKRRFENAIKRDPDDPLAHFGLGLLSKDDADYEAAGDHLNRALDLAPDLVVARNHLAEVYQLQGRHKDALQALESAIETNRSNRKTLFIKAVSLQNLERYDQAIRLFERLSATEPVFDEVFYNLGICYGRQNRLALAHYNFGIFFRRIYKPAKARFHFEKAEELGKHDMDLVRKIREAAKGLSD